MRVLVPYLTPSRHSALVGEILVLLLQQLLVCQSELLSEHFHEVGRGYRGGGLLGVRTFGTRQASMKAAPINQRVPMGALVLERAAWRVLWAAARHDTGL